MHSTDQEDTAEPLTLLEGALLVVVYVSSGLAASVYLLAAWHWFSRFLGGV